MAKSAWTLKSQYQRAESQADQTQEYAVETAEAIWMSTLFHCWAVTCPVAEPHAKRKHQGIFENGSEPRAPIQVPPRTDGSFEKRNWTWDLCNGRVYLFGHSRSRLISPVVPDYETLNRDTELANGAPHGVSMCVSPIWGKKGEDSLRKAAKWGEKWISYTKVEMVHQ
ncbi:hypothetical protein N7457_009139 [Penicillium paradoxum]|uniref:uncharacterized protein n=1 Tax=Penicillium paradoxum TaxID=176176 RepID=UPI0025467A6F|nr:uncharacterized protein N7457_009139 [Penicillium paradoxum]KAJ5774243.1 hypothetical protein N7457_009139 [Penicillium paradoxum]